MSLASIAARLAGRESFGAHPGESRTSSGSVSRRVRWAALACGAAIALALYHAYVMFWLCDDAFISFRYARQLADGFGLVFNRGERVEGYTNFLWVLEVALGMKLGLGPETTSVALSVLATVLLFLVVARVVRSSPFSRGALWPAVLALLLLAANRSIAVWTTGGLETRQFTLLSVLAIVAAGEALGRWAPEPRSPPTPDGAEAQGPFAWVRALRFELAASVFAALAEATRPEGGLVFACVAGAYIALGPVRGAFRDAARRRRAKGAAMAGAGAGPWQSAFTSACAVVLPALVIVGLHYVFRRVYYGDWLPNTYYAKHVRPWPESGDKYFVAAWIEHGGYVLLPLALAGTALRAARGDFVHLVAWAVLLPHTWYVRQIGGDHFEFRPLDLHWPLLTAMAVDAIVWLAALQVRPGIRALAHPRGLGAAAIWLVLLEFGTIVQRAFEHETRGRTSRGSTYKLRGHVKPDSTPELRWVLPSRLVRMYNDASFYCVEHQSCTRQGEHRAYWALLEKEFGPYRSMTREEAERALPDNLIWARDAVGFAPYVLPNVTVIDLFGLTDRTIARNPVTTPNERRVMAHDRRPPPGYLTKRGINIQLGAASRSLGEALRHGYWAVRVRPDLWIPFRTFEGEWVAEQFRHRHIFSQFWFDPVVPLNNRGWVDGEYTHGVSFIGRFDDGLDGFTVVPAGAARVRSAASAPKALEAVGTGFLTTEHESLGARGTARATSRPFTARGILAFVVSGTGTAPAAVRLLRGKEVLKAWSARGARTFQLETLALSPYAGDTLTLELVDDATDGFVSIDQIMLMEPDARGA